MCHPLMRAVRHRWRRVQRAAAAREARPNALRDWRALAQPQQLHGGWWPAAAHLHGIRLAVLRELFEHRVGGFQPFLVLLRLVMLDDRLEQRALLGRQPIVTRPHASVTRHSLSAVAETWSLRPRWRGIKSRERSQLTTTGGSLAPTRIELVSVLPYYRTGRKARRPIGTDRHVSPGRWVSTRACASCSCAMLGRSLTYLRGGEEGGGREHPSCDALVAQLQ